MADDIDIEEHDILENPALRRVFPDISIIKEEISKTYEEVPEQEGLSETITNAPSSSVIEPDCIKENLLNHHPQVIIPFGIKEEYINDIENETDTAIHTPLSIVSNKIILGSKPNKSVSIPLIIVKDIGPYLHQNSRYCKECQRLYPHKLKFDEHIKKIHMAITNTSKTNVKQNQPKPKIKLRTENESLVGKPSKKKSSDLETMNCNLNNNCFHCKKIFPDQKSLIEHIYEVLSNKHDNINLHTTKAKATVVKNKKDSSITKGNRIKINTKIKCNKKVLQETDENNDSCQPLISKLSFESDKTDKINVNKEAVIKNKKQQIKQCTSQKSKKQDKIDLHLSPSIRSTRSKNKQIPVITYDTNIEPAERAQKMEINKSKDFNELCSEPIHKRAKPNEHNFKESMICEKKSNQHLSVSKASTSKKRHTEQTRNKHLSMRLKIKQKIKETENGKDSDTEDCQDTTIEIVEDAVESDKKANKLIYECIYCSYILPTSKAYYMHVAGKHKVKKVSKANRVTFDVQCKYCPSKSSNIGAHNKHIYTYHDDLLYRNKPKLCASDDEESILMGDKITKDSVFGKYKSFGLDSVTYKCNKCDIFFLSSYIAINHDKHMEMLVNWKCKECARIFKQGDKHLHLKQHQLAKKLIVYELNASDSEHFWLLYSCTKCAIHFTEERYIEHYSNCDKETPDSVYCRVCDILIDKNGYNAHEVSHETGKTVTDFTIIAAAIIENTQEQGNGLPKKRKRLYEQVNCFTYCQTCKCYLSDIALTRKAHIESRCANIPKHVCEACGLVITNVAIKSHRKKHKTEPNTGLQHYKFFNDNGIQINPPIPVYPSCTYCKVHFINKTAITQHVCKETKYSTCNICAIKLSETAFKLHQNFHNYSKVPHLLNKNKPPSLVVLNNVIDDKKQEKYNTNRKEDSKEHKNVMQKENVLDILENDSDTQTQEIEVHKNSVQEQAITNVQPGELKYDRATQKLEISSKKRKYYDPQEENDLDQQKKHDAGKHASANQNIEIGTTYKDNSDDSNLIYVCKGCKIGTDSYDKVIEHCQNHYTPIPKPSSLIKLCTICSVKFEHESYNTHQAMHSNNATCNLLTYDPTYFLSDNDTWIGHIFRSLPDSIRKNLVSKSIYQAECRLKMNVVQKGPLYLTVYKCDKCGNFIDPDCLLNHVIDCACSFVIKHSCSVCGLPFRSRSVRIKHERIHKSYENVRIKSYNIVLINCEAHANYTASILDAIKQYVLYQCRVCNGIVDKLQRNVHQCQMDKLKICSICKLLIYNEDYNMHLSRHKNLPRFNSEHMKVILFGIPNTQLENSTLLLPSFTGMVYDYTLYKCSKCEAHVKHFPKTLTHVCFEDTKCKCNKCGYFFPQRSLKSHLGMHDLDPEYNVESIKIVNFDPVL